MHTFAVFNGEILKADDIRIPAVSSAALYGRGVFTTVAILDRRPFIWEKHLRRLASDAVRVGVDAPPAEQITEALDELIARNGITEGRARITIFDASSSPLWPTAVPAKADVLMMSSDTREVPQDLRLAFSPYPINSSSPLAGVKSCNYLENLLAIEEARARGFDEAIRINEKGSAASACMANIFWLKGVKLCTPPRSSGCLPGTTREYVMENVECVEAEVNAKELANADGIFLTSAGLGIAAVSEIEGRKLSAPRREFLDLLRR